MAKAGRGICRSGTLPLCLASDEHVQRVFGGVIPAAGVWLADSLWCSMGFTASERSFKSHSALVCKTSQPWIICDFIPPSCFCLSLFLCVSVFVRHPRALPGMMQWIRSQRPGESGINIITADFVELGEFISAVITLNYHLDDDDDDATWEPAEGVREHSRPPLLPAAGSVLSLFSLWHLFQEGSCTAPFHFI